MRTRRALRLVLLACVAAGCAAEPGPPQHLVLISVDTLRADHLGSYGNPYGLTPNLDAFATRSVRFARTYAPTPFTLPSIAALMSGRHPIQLGIQANLNRMPDSVTTLAKALHRRGFKTAAVVGNPVLAGTSGLAAGFDHFDAALPALDHDPGAVAAWTTDRALAMLKRIDHASSIFLWVHYLDPHGPYTPPDTLRAQHQGTLEPEAGGALPVANGNSGIGAIPAYQHQPPHRDASHYRAGYAAEVSLVDRGVGRLLDALASSERLDKSAVVFTADHGESLGEQDLWFDHGENLSDASLLVPLMIAAPELAPAVREDLASLLDVAPTLRALFDLPAPAAGEPSGQLDGKDLLAPTSTASASEYRSLLLATSLAAASHLRIGVVQRGFKFVRTRTGTRNVFEDALYQLPDETHDVARARPDVARRLRAEMSKLLAGEKLESVWRDPPPRSKRALRALGYVVD